MSRVLAPDDMPRLGYVRPYPSPSPCPVFFLVVDRGVDLANTAARAVQRTFNRRRNPTVFVAHVRRTLDRGRRNRHFEATFSPFSSPNSAGSLGISKRRGAAGSMGALVGEERELKSEQRVEARTYVPLNIHFMGAHRDYCSQGGPALVDFVCCNHTWFFFPCLSSAVITCTLSFSDEEFAKRPT